LSDADRRVHRAALTVLVAAVLAGFGPGVFGDFLWDDDTLIVHNRYVRDWSYLPRAFSRDFWDASGVGDTANPTYGRLYRPIVKVAYLIQFQVFGTAPLGWHLVSLGLHLTCVLLAFGWLRDRLRKDRPSGPAAGSDLAAAAGALLFALHPTRVESVTWVSGSTDLWMAFFVLAGLRFWDRSRGVPGALAAGGCFVLGALAKEAAVVVPFVLAADVVLRGGRPPSRVRLAAILVVMVAFLGLRFAWLPPPVGAIAQGGAGNAVSRVLASIGHFAASTLWPWTPSTQVGRQVAVADGVFAQAGWAVALGAVVLLAFAGLATAGARRRGARPWLADLLWFAGPLLPVVNLFPMGTYTLVSERFLYLPMLGAAAVAARGVLAGLGGPRRVRVATVAAAAGLSLAFVAVTVPHLARFQDDAALWAYEHRRDPHNLVVLQQSATLALRERRHDDAVALLDAGCREAMAQRDLGRAASFALGLGTALMERAPDADTETLHAVRDFLDRFEETGRLELQAGGIDLSFVVPQRVHARLVRDPQRFLGPRAAAWARTAAPAQAESFARDLVDRAPHDPGGYVLLALLQARQGRFEDAADVLRAAEHRLPGDPDVALTARRIQVAQDLSRVPVSDEAQRLLRDVRLQLALGSPASARRVLAAWPDEALAPERVLAAVQIEVADRRFQAARALLDEAARRDPERRDLWQSALDQIDAVSAREARR
jgi:tetratricopeptide (TPR) repeat protein